MDLRAAAVGMLGNERPEKLMLGEEIAEYIATNISNFKKAQESGEIDDLFKRMEQAKLKT